MPQKKKGKNKSKGGKNKGKGGGGQNKNQGKQRNAGNRQSGNSPNKQQNKAKSPDVQQQRRWNELMQKQIDAMYLEHTQKRDSLKTFFGIFTHHNVLQLRQLMKASIPHINDQLSNGFLKSTQDELKRDLNQFIFLGDVPVGAYVTELQQKGKWCEIKAFCVLPYFRNFGCGSRLMVHLVKAAVKRKELNSLNLSIDAENEKGIAFFKRFGFEIAKKVSPKNGVIENGDGNEEKEKEDETEQLKMILNVKLFRQSTLVLVKKQIQNQKGNQSPKK